MIRLLSTFVCIFAVSSGLAVEITIVSENNHGQCESRRLSDIKGALEGKFNVIIESQISAPSVAIPEDDYVTELKNSLNSYGISSTPDQLKHIRGMEDVYLNRLMTMWKFSDTIFFSLEATALSNQNGIYSAQQIKQINNFLSEIRRIIDIDPIFTAALNRTFSNVESVDKNSAKKYFQNLEIKDTPFVDVWNKIAGVFNKTLVEFPKNMHSVLSNVFGATYAMTDSEGYAKAVNYANQYVAQKRDLQEMIRLDPRVQEVANASRVSLYLYGLYLRDQFISTHVINNIRYFATQNPSLPIKVYLGAAHMKYLENALKREVDNLNNAAIKYDQCGKVEVNIQIPEHKITPRAVRLNPTLEIEAYTVYDLNGKEQLKGSNSTPFRVEKLMADKLPTGVYLISYSIKNYGFTTAVKTVLLKK